MSSMCFLFNFSVVRMVEATLTNLVKPLPLPLKLMITVVRGAVLEGWDPEALSPPRSAPISATWNNAQRGLQGQVGSGGLQYSSHWG